MWHSLTMEKIDQLKELSSVEPKGLIQASTNFSEGRMRARKRLKEEKVVTHRVNRFRKLIRDESLVTYRHHPKQ